MSNASGTATKKVTIQSILNAESRWNIFLPPDPTGVSGSAGNPITIGSRYTNNYF